jgi:hypothetical protein
MSGTATTGTGTTEITGVGTIITTSTAAIRRPVSAEADYGTPDPDATPVTSTGTTVPREGITTSDRGRTAFPTATNRDRRQGETTIPHSPGSPTATMGTKGPCPEIPIFPIGIIPLDLQREPAATRPGAEATRLPMVHPEGEWDRAATRPGAEATRLPMVHPEGEWDRVARAVGTPQGKDKLLDHPAGGCAPRLFFDTKPLLWVDIRPVQGR